MKKLYFIFALGSIFMSCSDNDSPSNGNDDGNEVSTADFLPLNNSNYWVYNIDGNQQQGRDSLYITGDVSMGGNTYKKLTTLHLPTGFFSNAVYNDGIRKQGDRLLLTGTAEFGFSEEFALDIPITDFVILKENAAANQQLASVSGSITQPYEDYNIKFDYTLSTKNITNLPTYTMGSQTYTNVKQVQTTLNLTVTVIATIDGFGTIPFQLMEPQNVLVSNQYYADGIGVVHVDSDIAYNLQDIPIPGVQLPIEQSASEHQEEILVHYEVD